MNQLRNNIRKKAFISYSHTDVDFAKLVAMALNDHGIEVFIDKWELMPGDSLIQKIFYEGLALSDVFIIILSRESVKSKWVKEELNSATIRRIEGVTKIIPVIKESCEIPIVLRSIVWADLSQNFETGIKSIVNSIFGISEKPPTGSLPDYIKGLNNSIGGLSKLASSLGTYLISTDDKEQSFEKSFSNEDVQNIFNDFTVQVINDAVDELAEYGLIKKVTYSGAFPYEFSYIEPTYALFLHFKNNGVNYNPVEDINMVVTTIKSKNECDAPTLKSITGLSPLRLNRAVAYLEDYGIIQVIQFGGSAPFIFSFVKATRKTREFSTDNL